MKKNFSKFMDIASKACAVAAVGFIGVGVTQLIKGDRISKRLVKQATDDDPDLDAYETDAVAFQQAYMNSAIIVAIGDMFGYAAVCINALNNKK